MKQGTDIAYQNKDIIAKLFGDRMKGKPISLLGVGSDLKVVDIRPTNIPLVQAKELRMDNVFELEDGSIAILDYESTYKKEKFLYHRKLCPMIQKRSAMDAPRANGRCCLRQPRSARSVCLGTHFLKEGFYVLHVADRYLKEGAEPDIHVMVLYTADIERASADFHRTALEMHVEPAYFVGVDSDAWMREVREGIENREISEELLMHLVLLPLTYKGDAEKQTAIKACVDLACQMEDKENETFALAGILTLTDKVINKENRERIREVLGMTQVGMMIFQDGWEKGKEDSNREASIKMLKKGFDYETIAEIQDISVEQVKAWEQEACAAV